MKRPFHLGLSILCLLALVVLPVISGAALHTATHGCRQSMSDRMPMRPAHSKPLCCAAHAPDELVPATAVDISLVLPPFTVLAFQHLLALAPLSAPPPPALPSASPPHAFPLPLRI